MSRIMAWALCAGFVAAGLVAPGEAQAQAPWTYGDMRSEEGDAFERGYRMGREEERRAWRERGFTRQDRQDWATGGERLRNVPRLDGRPYGAYGYERFEEGWLGEGRLTD